jgi:Trk K+ transport system NAD-binding subunit
VPRTIARVDNPKSAARSRRLSVDTTVSATDAVRNPIEQLIPRHSCVHLMRLRHADSAIAEGIVPPDSRVTGRSRAEIAFPPGVVLAVTRCDQGAGLCGQPLSA